MSREDGRCPSCGASLDPFSPICPSCRRNILQTHVDDPGGYKIQQRPPTIALTPKNLVIGGIIVLLIATVPIIVFLSLVRSENSQPTLIVKTVVVHDQPTQVTPIVVNQQSPTPTVGSTPTQAVTLPCNVNLATWLVPSGWVFQNGSLYNDGRGHTTLTAPCQIGTPNYAVEVKIQATKYPDSPYITSGFGIFLHRAPGQNGWQEYETGVQTNGQCNFGRLAFISDANSDCSTLAKIGFTPDTSTHIYRAEVRDNIIRFFIDGGLVGTATDNRLLTTQGDQAVGIYDENTQLQMSSFKVTALS